MSNGEVSKAGVTARRLPPVPTSISNPVSHAAASSPHGNGAPLVSIVGTEATHETYRLLSDGISDKMSAVAAGEADKVRDCLAPVRQTLVQVMNLQLIGNSNLKQLYILSPDEDKIMRALAITRGEDGQTGKNVAIKKLLEQTGLSDIRFRTTMRMLTSKVFANELSYPKLVQSGTGMASIVMVDSVSLWDDGEDYIIKMGYAK